MPIASSDKAARKRSRVVRLVVLLVILAASTTLGLLHQLLSARPPVSVDALCPFGGIESLWTVISTGALIRRIAWSSFILLGAVLLTSVLFRRSFCGHLCPLGTLQELFGRLGKPLFKRSRIRASLVGPKPADRGVRLLKYLVLGVFTIWAFATATLAIRPFDPWVAYQHLSSPDLFAEFAVGFGVLVAALAGSLLLDRAFCKYLCPMGAFLALISRASLFKVRRRAASCIDCKACDRSCPVNIQVSTRETVHDWECINCNECVNACPVQDTLEVSSRNGRRLSPTVALWATVGIFTAVIAATTLTGSFQWTMKDITVEAQAAGSFDPNLITGRNSLREIAQASGIPLGVLQETFGVTDQDLDSPVKEIKDSYGFDTEAVRQFVIEKLGRGQ